MVGVGDRGSYSQWSGIGDWCSYSQWSGVGMALSDRIKSSHSTGLYRIDGLWRIYVDNLEDKVTLMAKVVTSTYVVLL